MRQTLVQALTLRIVLSSATYTSNSPQVVTVVETATAPLQTSGSTDGSGGGNNDPVVVTLTATAGQSQATGGVVVETVTASSTSTGADGSQVVVVKTLTSSIHYTRPATSAVAGQLQTSASSAGRSFGGSEAAVKNTLLAISTTVLASLLAGVWVIG